MHVWSRGSGSLHRRDRRTGSHGRPARSIIGRGKMTQAQLAQGQSPLLAVRDVSVVFGGIVALNGVSFDMHQGQILGLIGPNGAGKTTLFNCLSRLYQPSAGDILMEGAEHPEAAAAPDRRNRHRPHLPERRAVSQPVGARQRPGRHPCPHQQRHHQRLAEAALGSPRRGRAQQDASTRSSAISTSRTSPMSRFPACRSAPRSASNWRARWPPIRRSCCSTSPPAASTTRRSTCSAT